MTNLMMPPGGGPSDQPNYSPPQQFPPYPQHPGYRPYPQPIAYPTEMPKPVRAARSIALALVALALCLEVFYIASGDTYFAGMFLFAMFPALCLATTTLFFGRAGSRAKVTAIVLAALMIFFNLLGAANGGSGGVLSILAGIAIIVLLSQRDSGLWFRRPR
ncbi:hypothetical protein [Nocardia crassostreae]|uniref:hypothetical protein n=1 Tax=Nocardia crassostreae TaxID=53428 RepID=UPI00082AC5F0|nr:hypothetical protein [Nocardia crassostreae]